MGNIFSYGVRVIRETLCFVCVATADQLKRCSVGSTNKSDQAEALPHSLHFFLCQWCLFHILSMQSCFSSPSHLQVARLSSFSLYLASHTCAFVSGFTGDIIACLLKAHERGFSLPVTFRLHNGYYLDG